MDFLQGKPYVINRTQPLAFNMLPLLSFQGPELHYQDAAARNLFIQEDDWSLASPLENFI